MKKLSLLAGLVLALAVAAGAYALAGKRGEDGGRMTGYAEAPSISTAAVG
jgi:hypothetical protein